jgi:ABC-type antimicrobial peptide transport system permease subunit
MANCEHELTMIARTAGAASPLVRPVAEAAQELDPNVSMISVKTMEQRMEMQLWPFKTVGRLFSICGGLALILATVGLAGVVIYTVNRRLREFGVRLAIGARPRDLMLDVFAGSARLMLPGLVVGTLLAAALARLARVAFYGVNVLNPATYAGVALLECVMVIVACISPAVRASRIDPVAALRAE